MGGPPFSGWYKRSFKNARVSFSAPAEHLKISSTNAISHSVARPANTWVYWPWVSAATSTGPNIRFGSVNLLSRISQYRAPPIRLVSSRASSLLAVPGGPSSSECWPASIATTRARTTLERSGNRSASSAAILARHCAVVPVLVVLLSPSRAVAEQLGERATQLLEPSAPKNEPRAKRQRP